MPLIILKISFYLMLLGSVQVCWAADETGNSIGISAGPLVSAGVEGWDHVATVYSAYKGFRWSEVPVELTLSVASSADNNFAALRMGPVGTYQVTEEFDLLYWLAPNIMHFDAAEAEPVTWLGVAIGGAFTLLIDRQLSLRGDIARLSGPGTNVYGGVGFIWTY